MDKKPFSDLFSESTYNYLVEIFDTNIEVNNWIVDNGSINGFLKIDNSEFKIIFEPINLKSGNGINIAFEKLINGIWSQEIVLSSVNASKIIGAILNGAELKLKNNQIDFIIFLATNEVDKRFRVYGFIANRYMKKFGINRKENIDFGKLGKGTFMANSRNFEILFNELTEKIK